MKALFFLFSTIVLAGGLLLAGEQPGEETGACQFTLNGEPAQPTITGPDNVVPLVHIIAQPDSPVEILSVDFSGSFLSIHDEEARWEPRCQVKLRNRSNQVIEDLFITEHLHSRGGGVGSGARGRRALPHGLAPGQEIVIPVCGGIGYPTVQNNYARILMAIEWVDFPDCRYVPSMRYPDRLGVMRPFFRPYQVLR